MEQILILPPDFDVGVNLETRKGSKIPTQRYHSRPPDAMREADRVQRTKFSRIKTRSLDSTYNCVGMVFAFRRAWIEPKYVPKLLEEDEYREVHRNEAVPGDLIVYYNNNDRTAIRHVGIIMKKEGNVEAGDWVIRVLSKWGQDGEYLHSEKDVPILFGTTRVYYSERK
ncbi:MAG: hypothetical protein F4077_03500 [Gammaproteobacteria bacterium]|nr:hypothetical protein [Gammaproteobacteria bacterium]MYI76816.1 hypothetical protein [Gammaproteobacteria bacterium]